MNDNTATYGPDILLALVLTATFGSWGLASAAVISLARHSPVVQEGVRQLAPQITDMRRQLPELLTVTPNDRALVRHSRAASAVATSQRQGPHKAQAGERGLTPEQFAADPLFKAIDDTPHRFVIGHSQGGKSTVLHGMARAWVARGDPVIVCDPDAAQGQWPGCEVAGYAEDYQAISRQLDKVRAIFDERSELYAEGQRDFEPIHLVLDEVHETFAEVPGARDFVLGTLGRRGARRGIKVTMGTQDNHKASLGLEDAGVLDNFITAEIEVDDKGRRVATVYRGNASRKKHSRQYLVPPLPAAKSFIKTKEEPAPARRPVAADTPRPTVLTERVPASLLAANDLDFLLDDLLAQPVPDTLVPPKAQQVTVQRDGGDVHVYVRQEAATVARATSRRGRGINARERRRRAEYIKAAQRGEKFDPTYKRLGGNRNEMHELFTTHKPR